MIIDIHAHVFPDELASRAVAALAACARISPHTDGTCAALQASMRRAGITHSVLAPIATKPVQARSINAWVVEMRKKYPALLPFGTLHPAQADWADEIERLVDAGIAGVKMHPDYQDFFVDEARVLPMMHALAYHKRVLLLHAGVDIGLPPPVHCPPERLAALLDAVPGLTVIAAHMGGYNQWDAVEQYLVGREVYFDTSYSLRTMGAEAMTRLIKAHGADRILFGTDSPWEDQAEAIQALQTLDLTEAELAAILGGNAARLLGLPECMYPDSFGTQGLGHEEINQGL